MVTTYFACTTINTELIDKDDSIKATAPLSIWSEGIWTVTPPNRRRLLTASGLGIPFYAIIRHATAPSVRDGEWTAATKDFTATIGTMEKLVYRSSERGTHNESRYEPDQLVRGSTDESLTLFESTCKRKVKI